MYSIPDSVRLHLSGPDDRVPLPREEEIGFYEDVIIVGLRFPFLREAKSLSAYLSLAPISFLSTAGVSYSSEE